MKRIIKNKVYDTATAKPRGRFLDNSALYQKKTGEYFLHIINTNTIKPMTYNEAAEWAKIHDETAYKSYFEKPAENSEKIIISLSIRKDSHEKIKRAAAIAGETISEYIESRIIKGLL